MRNSVKVAMALVAGLIVWKRPDGTVAITSVEIGTAEEEAQRLKRNGDVPHDWDAVAYNPPRNTFPADRSRRNAWIWDGQKIVDDPSRSTSTIRSPRVER